MNNKKRDEYQYCNASPDHTEGYLWQPVLSRLNELRSPSDTPYRVLDLGCGNGAFTGTLSKRGYEMVGVEPSESGVDVARRSWPDLKFHVGSAYDDLQAKLGAFDVVTSLEVVEHVYAPRDFARTIFKTLKPGGLAVISTPFHGYWKNLMLAITGKLDSHHGPLWDHGHIKFWSVPSLTELLTETGFTDISFLFAGRRYPFSKSMIAFAHKPSST
jgi:2-polyprenyl-6-hydroxyphenyl methylase/3-demethylubiquinone-9 3-methyltransferase